MLCFGSRHSFNAALRINLSHVFLSPFPGFTGNHGADSKGFRAGEPVRPLGPCVALAFKGEIGGSFLLGNPIFPRTMSLQAELVYQ